MISFFLKDFQMSFKSSYITENKDIWNLNLSQKSEKERNTEGPRLTRFHTTRISVQHGFGLGTKKFT